MEFETENTKLRPFSENDIPELARLANNRSVSINMRDAFPFPYTMQDAKKFVDMCKKRIFERWDFQKSNIQRRKNMGRTQVL